jgi:hypothetical protein
LVYADFNFGTPAVTASTNPYAAQSAQPKSAQQTYSTRGTVGPYNPAYVPPPPPPVPAPTSFGGVTQQNTFRYDPVLPPLTPEQQALLATRRRLATRGFEETSAAVERERSRAEAEAVRQRQDIARAQQLQSRAGMQTLAGRGVGRSPMFVNPFQRQLAESSQRQIGELESGLANTLAQLQSALRQSEIARERELSQIDFDAATFRSDITRLLGA